MEYISSVLTACPSIMVFVPYTLRFWEFWKHIEDSEISWYSLPHTIFIHLPFTWMLMDPWLLCLQPYPELFVFLYACCWLHLEAFVPPYFQLRLLKFNLSVKRAQRSLFQEGLPKSYGRNFFLSFVLLAPLPFPHTQPRFLIGPSTVQH